MNQNYSKKPFKSLKKKLLTLVLLTSTLVTTAVTGVTFYLEYQMEMNEQEKIVRNTQESSSKSLANSIWKIDPTSTETKIKEILSIKDILRVQIKNAENQIIFDHKKASNKLDSSIFEKSYSLLINSGLNDIENLGTVTLTITKQFIYERLIDKLISLLVSQSIKTFLVSFLLLYVFSITVTNYIIKLDKYLSAQDWTFTKEPKKIDLSTSNKLREDEIDHLAHTLNELFAKIYLHNNLSKEHKKEAAEARETKFALLELICREVRGPITIILSISNILFDSSESKEQAKNVKVLQNTAKKILGLVDRLILYSKITSGKSEIYQDFFYYKEFLDSLAKTRSKALSLKKLKLNWEVDLDLKEEMVGDKEKLQVLILELLENCEKYALEGEISIKSWVEKRKKNHIDLYFSIEDSGPGMPKEKINSNLTDFDFLRKPVQTIGSTGLGIGLPLCYKIVSILGGKLEVEESSRKGTKVTFFVPAQMATPIKKSA